MSGRFLFNRLTISDTAATFPAGNVSAEAARLIAVTKTVFL